jgi:hypothetical protein
MRRGFLALLACGKWACATATGPEAKLAPLWKPVALGADATRLKIEPLNSVALGEAAHLRVLSTQTATADCKTADGEVLGGDAHWGFLPSSLGLDRGSGAGSVITPCSRILEKALLLPIRGGLLPVYMW